MPTRDPDLRLLIKRPRRRAGAIAVIAVAAVVVLILLLTGGGDDPPAPPPPDPIAGLSDAELAGQHLIAGFDGTRVPRGLEQLVAEGRIAGLILFADNIADRGATARLVGELQGIERPPGLDAPLAVMVDQEGGSVRRLPGPPTVSAEQMGRRGTEFAAEQGRATAESLLGYGVNVDLAPVLDLARPDSAIAAEGRSFGSSPTAVTDVAVDGFAAGLREGGVAATAKHFPGLGGAAVNTDLEAQRVDLPLASLQSTDEAPFQAFAEGGGELVMLGLASYPAFGDRPAALDPAIAADLRDRIGFEGVTITDSLDAAAAQAFGDRDRVAVAATSAGSDLLLYGDWRTAEDVGRTLTSGLRSDRLDRTAFEDSARRVLALRAGLATGP